MGLKKYSENILEVIIDIAVFLILPVVLMKLYVDLGMLVLYYRIIAPIAGGILTAWFADRNDNYIFMSLFSIILLVVSACLLQILGLWRSILLPTVIIEAIVVFINEKNIYKNRYYYKLLCGILKKINKE